MRARRCASWLRRHLALAPERVHYQQALQALLHVAAHGALGLLRAPMQAFQPAAQKRRRQRHGQPRPHEHEREPGKQREQDAQRAHDAHAQGDARWHDGRRAVRHHRHVRGHAAHELAGMERGDRAVLPLQHRPERTAAQAVLQRRAGALVDGAVRRAQQHLQREQAREHRQGQREAVRVACDGAVDALPHEQREGHGVRGGEPLQRAQGRHEPRSAARRLQYPAPRAYDSLLVHPAAARRARTTMARAGYSAHHRRAYRR